MRLILLFVIVFSVCACDSNRLYEKNHDFDERYWLSAENPEFQFEITDTTLKYNVYCNLRNSLSYPLSRIFVTYSLQDSTGHSYKNEMISIFLFEEKSGKPLGSSALGNVYDHQTLLLKDYSFTKAGEYTLGFEQFMRMDTLQGILAVGFRLEAVSPNE